MNAAVIGLGEVGGETYKTLQNSEDHTIFGVEIDERRRETFTGLLESEVPTGMDAYVICVFHGHQVQELIEQIGPGPLIIIESTISPRLATNLQNEYPGKGYQLISFPHRLMPGDPLHQVSNLARVVGIASKGSEEEADCWMKFTDLYVPPMNRANLMLARDFKHAAISKVVENAYRFAEIAVSQAFKSALDGWADYEEIRRMCNTKWNIDIREVRDGIKLKCLPKDMDMMRGLSPSTLVEALWRDNERHKADCNRSEG